MSLAWTRHALTYPPRDYLFVHGLCTCLVFTHFWAPRRNIKKKRFPTSAKFYPNGATIDAWRPRAKNMSETASTTPSQGGERDRTRGHKVKIAKSSTDWLAPLPGIARNRPTGDERSIEFPTCSTKVQPHVSKCCFCVFFILLALV